MQDQRNLLLAIVLSVVILFGFQFYFGEQPPETVPGDLSVGVSDGVPTVAGSAPSLPGAVPAVPADGRALTLPPDRETAIGDSNRVQINPDRADVGLQGSISLVGGRIDDIVLARYHETVDPESAEIALLSPLGAPHPYYAGFGWVAGAGEDIDLPGPDTLWSADQKKALTADTPLTLSWDNGAGLLFEQRIEIDDAYMISVTQSVTNSGINTVELYPYGLISRTDQPKTLGYYILHEGPLGVFNGTLQEVDYDDLRETPQITVESTGGWIGITDKYWLAALIPDQTSSMTANFKRAKPEDREKFQVDMLLPAVSVGPRATVSTTSRLFAGAKVVEILDGYESSLGIQRFDLAVDWGWFYFLTKPLFRVLHYLNGVLGNFGLAILLVTVMIKAVFFPLANKSYTAMSKLKKLQPEMLKLREKFGDDRQRLNQEMMALYKREKANPLAGCLPIVIQIPVFFSLYKVLFVSIEMRHAPFYGWIHDLSARDPTSLFNLFGLIPWAPPSFLAIGLWPILMGGTMFLQQKLNPAPPDPIQAKVMMALPLVFTFLFATFPAGLVIYWTWNNTLSILQQWIIMRRMGVKA